ncbi:hypothetical protein EYC84_007768 [Monilinia fructicola]|uniref:Uncharacterized protein n=1 Tax=Monilinia fructicola TaxID=38448 RepID=A0A5M9JLC1_MONFR|nr:hypothetical protein EYC84_007768 [Monilinia fructicola]
MSTKFISFVPLSNSDRRPSILEAMISNNMRARQNNLDRRSKLAWFGFVNWVGFELRLGIVRVVQGNLSESIKESSVVEAEEDDDDDDDFIKKNQMNPYQMRSKPMQ